MTTRPGKTTENGLEVDVYGWHICEGDPLLVYVNGKAVKRISD